MTQLPSVGAGVGVLLWNGFPDRPRWPPSGASWPKAGPGCRIIPRQPGAGIGKDRLAMLLHRHQILQRIDACLQTGGNQTGEHTGNIGTMLRGIEERVLALANAQFQGPLGDVVVQWRPRTVKTGLTAANG